MPEAKRFFQPILTEDQVREIRKTYKMADKIAKMQGRKMVRYGLVGDLALKYGVSKRAIAHIRQGDRWKRLK